MTLTFDLMTFNAGRQSAVTWPNYVAKSRTRRQHPKTLDRNRPATIPEFKDRSRDWDWAPWLAFAFADYIEYAHRIWSL